MKGVVAYRFAYGLPGDWLKARAYEESIGLPVSLHRKKTPSELEVDSMFAEMNLEPDPFEWRRKERLGRTEQPDREEYERDGAAAYYSRLPKAGFGEYRRPIGPRPRDDEIPGLLPRAPPDNCGDLVRGGTEIGSAMQLHNDLLEDQVKALTRENEALKRDNERLVALQEGRAQVQFQLDPAAAAKELRRHHELFLVRADTGERSLLATFDAAYPRFPKVVETSPQRGYDKNLAKINGLPCLKAALTCDGAGLTNFLRWLTEQNKAAIINETPRIYLAPQVLTVLRWGPSDKYTRQEFELRIEI